MSYPSANDRAKRLRQIFNQVTSNHRDLSNILGCEITREAVNVYAEPRRIERLNSLAEQGGDDSREHVARTARRHARIAGSIKAITLAVCYYGAVPFENHNRIGARSGCELGRNAHALRL